MNRGLRVSLIGLAYVTAFGGHTMLLAVTSELRTPLSIHRGQIHYPLKGIERDDLWTLDAWAVGYVRKACSAYFCGDCSNNRGVTKTTAPLSSIFFGASDFAGQQAFAGGTLTKPVGNPGLVFSKLSPRFDYNEHGVYLGFHAQRDICDSNWHVGWRASLPIKRISVEQRRSGGTEQPAPDIGEVIVRRQEFTNAGAGGLGKKMNNVNSYRLDFLSTLLYIDGTPLVHYGTGGEDDTTIAGVAITPFDERNEVSTGNARAPMCVMQASNGSLARVIKINSPNEVDNLARDVEEATLNANGSQGYPASNDSGRLVFVRENDYADQLGKDPKTQRTLFLVPNAEGNGSDVIYPDANAVQNAIEYVLNSGFDTSATAYFRKHGVDLNISDCVAGPGDLYTEWYGGYHKKCWYLDALVGSFIPTGRKIDDVRRIYRQPTGNNGHFEFRGGLEGGVQRSWFALRGLATYNRAFDHTQLRAPAFRRATIKNIPVGDAVPARVDWGYFWGNLDVTIFNPWCCECGLVLGYELYAKQKDKICFCLSRATDFLGDLNELDGSVAEKYSDVRTHKIRAEVFHRVSCCELFLGASYIVAGRHSMKETEAHLGISFAF